MSGASARLKKQNQPTKEFDKWILSLAKDLKEYVHWGEIQRTQWAVTMRRRFRGTSANDWAGGFYPNMIESQRWCDVTGAGLHSLNIVKGTIRANEAVMVEARVKIEVEAGTSEAEAKGAASVGQGVNDYLAERDWTESLEARINQSTQIAGSIFLTSRKNPLKLAEPLKRQLWQKVKVPVPGEYACACGSGGPFEGESEPDDIGLGTTMCPDCGNPAVVTSPPDEAELNAPAGEEEFRPADNETNVVPMFEIRMDETHTQGGEIDKAEWFERHYLVSRCHLEAEYPHVDFGQPEEWSYSLKWQQALKTGAQNVDWLTQSQRSNRELDQFEVRELYLTPARYKGRVESADFKLLGPDDEVIFEVKAGQKTIEVAPDGICVRMCGEHVLKVYTKKPDYKEEQEEYYSCDFRDEYTMIQFLADADSVWSLGLTELEPIQMDINNLRTIDQQSKEKNSVTNILFDSLMWEVEDFDTDLVPTRAGFVRDKPLRDYVEVLPAPKLGNDVIEATTWLMGAQQKLSGVQPALIGESQPGQPYAAQLLQKQQSQGLLAPSQQSKAQGKARWAKQQLKLAQSWPEERFDYIKSRYGLEWHSDDVRAFCECNIDRDLIIDYVPGTEISTGVIEQQVKLDQLIQHLGAIAGASPEAINEQTWQEVVGKLVEFGGISELDVGNTAGDLRLAQDRYRLMQELCEEAEQNGEELTINLMNHQQMQQIRAEAAATGQIPAPDPLVEQILSDPHFFVTPGEVYGTMREFYCDKLRALVAAEHPDELLINVIIGQIARQQVGFVEQGQQQVSTQLQIQKPAMDAQAEMAQQQQAQQSEQEQGANAEAHGQAMQQAAAQEASADAARGHEAEQAGLQAQEAEAQRQHEHSILDKTHEHETVRAIADLAKLEAQKQAQKAKGVTK